MNTHAHTRTHTELSDSTWIFNAGFYLGCTDLIFESEIWSQLKRLNWVSMTTGWYILVSSSFYCLLAFWTQIHQTCRNQISNKDDENADRRNTVRPSGDSPVLTNYQECVRLINWMFNSYGTRQLHNYSVVKLSSISLIYNHSFL